MFKELQSLAEKSPLAMMISAEGDQLRVVITQKKAGAAGTPLSLSILAKPEDLDADLPASIAIAAGELAKPAPVAEQVKAQVDTARASAKPPRKSTPKPKAAKPKPVKKHAAPKLHKVKKTIRVKPTAPRTAAPAASKKQPKLRSSRPGAEACIADYLKLKPQYGDKLTRELFMEKAETGRRFERVFGNWNKFVEAAQGEKTLGPAGDDKTKPLPLEHSAPAGALPDTWPFPTTPKDVELCESKDHTGDGWDVYDRDGNYLSSITTHPEIGEKIQLAGRFPAEEVISIDGRRVITRPATTPAPVNSTPSQDAAAPAAAAGPGRIVVTRTGTALVSRMEIQAEENMKIDVPGHGRYRVVDFDEKKIVVELITREVTA